MALLFFDLTSLAMFAPGLDQRFFKLQELGFEVFEDLVNDVHPVWGGAAVSPLQYFAQCFQTLAKPPGNPAASLIDCQSSWRSLATVGGGGK